MYPLSSPHWKLTVPELPLAINWLTYWSLFLSSSACSSRTKSSTVIRFNSFDFDSGWWKSFPLVCWVEWCRLRLWKMSGLLKGSRILEPGKLNLCDFTRPLLVLDTLLVSWPFVSSDDADVDSINGETGAPFNASPVARVNEVSWGNKE